jgi:protein phosphatase methylesterase 1
MGAAPIVHAAPLLQEKGYTVAGVGVLDVVEGALCQLLSTVHQLTAGTAVESLPLMKSILGKRPTTFGSVPEAIGWQ